MTEIESRIAELVDQFRRIGETQMRDLPIYNTSLSVEAVGFQPIGEHWIGVLVTPWFMSAILLPPAKTAMDYTLIGKKTRQVLPAATFDFVSGGVETVGGYESLPLSSPMGAFPTQDSAHREAQARLLALMTPPEETPQSTAPSNPGRRIFLRGSGKASQAKL